MEKQEKTTVLRKAALLLLSLCATISLTFAQDVITVEAANLDISFNLNLEAVATIFGDAENLEDFERKLNDPELQISNLDLNQDGVVDYLRVIEAATDQTHVVTIQAVLGNDLFQDIATIDVERDASGETSVQLVGDVYMYGPDYIITPVYVRPPVFFVYFWGPVYRPWYSPYYYGYYPHYYHPWRPYPTYVYQQNVHVHVNVHNTYHYTNIRKSRTAANMHKNTMRNDYASKHPDRSFAKRNDGFKNTQELRQVKQSATLKRGDTRVSKERNAEQGRNVKLEAKSESRQVKEKRTSASQSKQYRTTTDKSTKQTVRTATSEKRPAAHEKRTVEKQTVSKQKPAVEKKSATKQNKSVDKKPAVKQKVATQKKKSVKQSNTAKATSQQKPASRSGSKAKRK
ncbi:MAG: hypothetical protein K9G76_02200 [Bacteroidales bacterium]|nr:hypothetical protein [Bacteroidales bacterium]MCF8404861.1 hypothetical protein [Bacteroidales bacterium]